MRMGARDKWEPKLPDKPKWEWATSDSGLRYRKIVGKSDDLDFCGFVRLPADPYNRQKARWTWRLSALIMMIIGGSVGYFWFRHDTTDIIPGILLGLCIWIMNILMATGLAQAFDERDEQERIMEQYRIAPHDKYEAR